MSVYYPADAFERAAARRRRSGGGRKGSNYPPVGGKGRPRKEAKNPRKGVPTPAELLAGTTPQESEADRIINELLAELGLSRDAARREAERNAQAEIARAQALAQALQNLGIPTNIQSIYHNAAGSLAGMAGGFSSEFRDLAGQQAAQQINMVSGTGQEGAIRNEGQGMGDVLYGVGGMIPGTALEQTGAAFASQAALQPGFTLQFGQLAAAQVMKDYVDNVLPEFTQKEAEIRMKRPEIEAELKQSRQQEAKELYEMGLITQRELARRMGVPNWRKFPNVRAGEGPAERPKASASLSKTLGYLVDEYGNPILNSKGKPIPLPKNADKVERFGSASAGYWAWNPETGEIINLLPPQQKQYAPKGYQLKTLKDGSTAIFDPNTGETTIIAPPPKGGKPKKPLTPAQQARYRGQALTFAEAALYGVDADGDGKWNGPDDLKPLSLAEALEELKKTSIPWAFGKKIITRYYQQRIKGPSAPKGKPASGGRSNTSAGGASLVPTLQPLMGYALSQGFTNLGTHNPASRLPGGGISDHAKWPAEAFDIGGFSGGWKNARARKLFNWLIRQPGVKYVILGDKIWSRERGLHAYTSGGHDSHIHVSGYGASV